MELSHGCLEDETGEDVHEEDFPSFDGPFLVVKVERCASFDEERHEDLHALEDPLNRGIFQVAAPYLELSSFARIGVDLLARGLEVLCGCVRLDMRIELRNLVKSSCSPSYQS